MAQRKISIAAAALVLGVGAGFAAPGFHRADNTKPGTAGQRGGVNGARIRNADQEPGNWMSHGRTYSEQRFSPLKLINDRNIGRLGLAWYYDLDTRRGQEATPLVVDGVIYFTTAWSKVVALEAATAKQLWTYDPKVPRNGPSTLAATWSIAAWPSGATKST